jgi:hypothetical protein
MANRRYFGSIRRRESGRWQIRYALATAFGLPGRRPTPAEPRLSEC